MCLIKFQVRTFFFFALTLQWGKKGVMACCCGRRHLAQRCQPRRLHKVCTRCPEARRVADPWTQQYSLGFPRHIHHGPRTFDDLKATARLLLQCLLDDVVSSHESVGGISIHYLQMVNWNYFWIRMNKKSSARANAAPCSTGAARTLPKAEEERAAPV